MTEKTIIRMFEVRRFLAVLIFVNFIGVAFFPCSGWSLIDNSTTGTGVIFGTVIDSYNNEGLSGVSITTSTGCSCVSDNGGDFTLTCSSGSFTLSAQRFGYQVYSRSVDLYAGSVVMVDIVMVCIDCPVERVLAEDDLRLNTLRRFRDEVLAQSAAGRSVIRYYYEVSPFITEMIEEGPGARRTFKALVEASVPMVRMFLR